MQSFFLSNQFGVGTVLTFPIKIKVWWKIDNTVSFDKMFAHGAAIFHHLRSLSIDFNFARCVTTSPQLHQDLPKQFAVLHRKENRGGQELPFVLSQERWKKKNYVKHKKDAQKKL